MHINIRLIRYFVCFFLLCIALGGCKKETAWKPGIPVPKEKIKIAIIHFNEISNSLYDYAHYIGTVEMQNKIGLADNQIIRKVNVFDNDLVLMEGVMRDCIHEGANIIIAVTFRYMDICEKLAKEFPQIIFVQTMGYKYNKHNFVNYSTRLYQARYLSGIVAGMKTKTGKIGYVAAMGKENSEVTGGINAFAIGVEEVNPEARIYVRVTHSWYDPMGETESANSLIAAGCDIIAAHCDSAMVQIAAQKAGVWSIGFNKEMSADAPDSVITSVIPYWKNVYTPFLESVINGTFRPASYFYGLEEKVVDITPLNEKLAAPETQAAVDSARQRIREGFNVFDGILEANNGTLFGEEGKTLSDAIILGGIDWYYQNVIVIR